jgi:hypothetical protein
MMDNLFILLIPKIIGISAYIFLFYKIIKIERESKKLKNHYNSRKKIDKKILEELKEHSDRIHFMGVLLFMLSLLLGLYGISLFYDFSFSPENYLHPYTTNCYSIRVA